MVGHDMEDAQRRDAFSPPNGRVPMPSQLPLPPPEREPPRLRSYNLGPPDPWVASNFPEDVPVARCEGEKTSGCRERLDPRHASDGLGPGIVPRMSQDPPEL
jgi:hypothetical protein